MLFVSVFPPVAPGPDSLKADRLVILTYWLTVDDPRGAAIFEKSRSPHRRRKKEAKNQNTKRDISNGVRKRTFLNCVDKDKEWA